MKIRVFSGYVMVLLLLLTGHTLLAQQRKITGKVTDKVKITPLQGVTVKVKESPVTVVTDGEGNFTISVNTEGAVLEFSYVGYETQEVKAGTGPLAIALVPADKQLDDVVVVGYGTVKRKDLTGAVSSVKAADIVRTPTSNAVEALQGRVPGADINRTSGKAGAGASIQIRGNRSITSTPGPLYVIDGIQGARIEDLNTNDIESIDVLRDASSTAIYGSAGANGVVIVTTKKGKDGKPKVTYNGYYGINGFTSFPKGRTGEDYLNLRREAYRTTGAWSSPADDKNIFTGQELAAIQAGQWVDWIDDMMHNGLQQSHTMSVAGGNDKTRVFLSGGYFNEKGRLKNDEFNRYSIRFNLEQKINNWIKTGIQSQLTIYNNDQRPDHLQKSTGLSPLGLAYDANGNINLRPIAGDPSKISPLVDDRGKNVVTNNTYTSNILVNPYLEINPLPGLTFRSTFGANLSSSRNGFFNDSTSFTHLDANQKYGDAGINNSAYRRLTWDNIITWNKQIQDHSLTVTGVSSLVHTVTDNSAITGRGPNLIGWQQFYNFQGVDVTTIQATSSYSRIDSRAYAGRINYGYKGKYLLTATARMDGDSRMGDANKWSMFPSVAGAWNVSSEKFMEGTSSVMNSLKVRLGYGITGNAGTGDLPYPTLSKVDKVTNLAFGDVAAPGYTFNSNIGNKDLDWEKTATTNLGLDMGFLKNRITASVDLYYARTYDMLYQLTLPFFTGTGNGSIPATTFVNAGKTVNKGVELVVNSANIKAKDFQWNTTLTFTSNSEKIKQLVDTKDVIPSSGYQTGSYLIGRPIHSFYTFKKLGIWQTSEAAEAANLKWNTPTGTAFKPGDIKLEDRNGDHVIDASDRQYLGSTVPKWMMGLQNTFSYKNFDLTVYVIMRWGQTINAQYLGAFNSNGAGNGLAMMDYWTPEHATNDFPRPSPNAFTNYMGYESLNYVDGSFLKVKNLSLGYTFPKSVTRRLFIDNLKAYATASNVLVISKNHLLKNYDPEAGGSVDNPLSKQVVFGLNLGF